MRILVISDAHGRHSRIETAIEAQPSAKHIFYLGDKLEDIDGFAEFYPDRTFYSVPGNCDMFSVEKTTREATLAGRKILYTHGHEFGVKLGKTRLIAYAKARNADIVLYGHTHEAETLYEDGMYIINPGSIGKGYPPSYAVIDLEDNGTAPIIINV